MAEQNQGTEQVPLGPNTTGRYVIVTAPAPRIDEVEQGLIALSDVAGVSPDETAEAGEVDPEALTHPEASVNFPDLGIRVAGGLSTEQVRKVQELTEEDNPILAIEPERRYTTLHSPPDSAIQ